MTSEGRYLSYVLLAVLAYHVIKRLTTDPYVEHVNESFEVLADE